MSVYEELQESLKAVKRRTGQRQQSAMSLTVDLYNRFINYVQIPNGRYASLLGWNEQKGDYAPYERNTIVAPPQSLHRNEKENCWEFALYLRLNSEVVSPPEGAIISAKFREAPGGYAFMHGVIGPDILIDPADPATFGPLFDAWVESVIRLFDGIWPDLLASSI